MIRSRRRGSASDRQRVLSPPGLLGPHGLDLRTIDARRQQQLVRLAERVVM